ncbi:LANO_0F03840g1_1 [Lachancea nothofagi CBS 11611]|uniref:LANO_0F03840g1_1 n=1 Tax=Lachancea nothofagi CBS 11611 TaxID=1266666 RepID=A0A1G4K7F7_9SACH|nr:LANO_0F03840g1_1 [Lachancea nothofagi CBS 11611]
MSLVTPLYFSAIQPNFYRGSNPREINIPFLITLGLKYIVSLTPEPLNNDPVMEVFCREKGIQNIHIECSNEKGPKGPKDKSKTKVKRKKKAVPIEYDVVVQCVQFLIDKRHYPCYIHCTNGELVTSLVVACLRKLSYWSTVSIFNEYLTYNSSINLHERGFIENFNLEIDINDLEIKDKVPWITVRASDVSESKQRGNSIQSKQSNVKRVASFPGMLPRLNFHSVKS